MLLTMTYDHNDSDQPVTPELRIWQIATTGASRRHAAGR
jgi:hypothetical protein